MQLVNEELGLEEVDRSGQRSLILEEMKVSKHPMATS